MELRQIDRGVFVMEAPQRYMGLEIGARMTALQLEGGVLVHSPIGVDPERIKHLGELKWIVAPNLLHHLYVGPWLGEGRSAWGVKGLPQKRSDLTFDAVFEGVSSPFGPEVEVRALECFPTSNEAVLFHRPSGTLIVTDLVFNLPATAPLKSRLAFRLLGGYPGCRTTVLERLGMDRSLAREEIGALLELPFDRIILAHGSIVESGGRDALARAFSWLGL